jgi:phenylpropionate dioxygenase-like ring-hydroxylating dioxygenase large terminal subunit
MRRRDISKPRGERGLFTAAPGRSFTLPSRYYVDPEISTLEQRRIFHSGWCYVGHVSDLQSSGTYLVESVAGQCVVLVRGDDGLIRCFYNVCQHRGHELLTGCGAVARAIVCPYHGWTYALDGALKHARFTDGMSDFDVADYSLRELRVSVCAGLLFVNLDVGATEFDVEFDGLESTFLGHLPDLSDFTAVHRYKFDIAANWKVVIDNFSEGYHIPVAHRKLSQVLDVEAANEAVIGGRFTCFKSRSLGGFEGFEIEPGEPYLSWTVWPNLCILSQPGSDNLIVFRITPNGPERCTERVDIYAPTAAAPDKLEALRSLFADNFNKEDISIVESVQRGLRSDGYDQGRYVAADTDAWYSESGVHRFHKQVLEALNAN